MIRTHVKPPTPNQSKHFGGVFIIIIPLHLCKYTILMLPLHHNNVILFYLFIFCGFSQSWWLKVAVFFAVWVKLLHCFEESAMRVCKDRIKKKKNPCVEGL